MICRWVRGSVSRVELTSMMNMFTALSGVVLAVTSPAQTVVHVNGTAAGQRLCAPLPGGLGLPVGHARGVCHESPYPVVLMVAIAKRTCDGFQRNAVMVAYNQVLSTGCVTTTIIAEERTEAKYWSTNGACVRSSPPVCRHAVRTVSGACMTHCTREGCSDDNL